MKLARLILTYLWDFIQANLVIARQVLSPVLRVTSETIELETVASTPLEILALSNLVTFTPGTLVLEFEPGRRITVHVLNDAASASVSIRERLEKPLLALTRP